MEKLNKSIGELVKAHISIYEEMEGLGMCSAKFARQLDFLEFWVDDEGFKKYNPFIDMDGNPIFVRDNPNFQPTEYENVVATYTLKAIEYVYSSPDGYAPIKIFQWYKSKNQHKEGWKISIYGKGLRLYYNGLLPRLPDYVSKYMGEMIRADICWDNPNKIPSAVIDLMCVNTRPDDSNRTYKMFGNGDLTARIYDKSLDLMKKDKGIHCWLYPEWYKNSCRRVEFVFRGKYAKSLTALEWLSECPTDGKINPINGKKREKALQNLYTVVNSIICLVENTLISEKDKWDLLIYMKEKIESKLNKFKKIKFSSNLKDLN